MEKTNIKAALLHADWRIWGEDGAASLLGLNASTLTYRMKQFGISKEKEISKTAYDPPLLALLGF